MTGQHTKTLKVFESLQSGDEIELTHVVKVGLREWKTKTVGTVVSAERRRHGLHHERNFDDKAFSDLIILKLSDGSLTTVMLDEFSVLKRLQSDPDIDGSIGENRK